MRIKTKFSYGQARNNLHLNICLTFQILSSHMSEVDDLHDEKMGEDKYFNTNLRQMR